MDSKPSKMGLTVTNSLHSSHSSGSFCPKMETNKDQNGVIQPLLTDLYQITMCYAYWKSNKRNDTAVFDLFFRKNPFRGEFCLFAGLEECLKFLANFQYSDTDIEYLKSVLPPSTEADFFKYLANLTTNDVTVYAIDEGMIVFPKVPLLRLEGPLPIVQLLETTLLTLVNYASLVATNAARFRMAAGPNKSLLEFGLRRAQGPDGGLSASRYCYIGGFDGTSNLLAGKLFGIPVRGTHAHAFVNSFTSCEELNNSKTLKTADGSREVDFVELCLQWREKVAPKLEVLGSEANDGELAAFISYAIAFPSGFLSLVDTYDVVRSGIPNFCAVALALDELGYKALGIRLDSGDLAYLSVVVRESFRTIAKVYDLAYIEHLTIVASNDINEETIHSLNQQVVDYGSGPQGHCIDSFGIGTHLVTCQKQPALGCVYKLVEVNGKPRIKLSEDVEKVTMPGKKDAYRLYGHDGNCLVDLLQKPTDPAPAKNTRVLVRHPFQESKRAYVSPAKVECLYKCYWKNGEIKQPLPTLEEIKTRAMTSLRQLRTDHKRALNPTPYKVSVSDGLYQFIHTLWLANAPIGELS